MLQPQNEKQPLPPRRDLGFRLSAAGFRLSARGGALRGRTRGSVPSAGPADRSEREDTAAVG